MPLVQRSRSGNWDLAGETVLHSEQAGPLTLISSSTYGAFTSGSPSAQRGPRTQIFCEKCLKSLFSDEMLQLLLQISSGQGLLMHRDKPSVTATQSVDEPSRICVWCKFLLDKVKDSKDVRSLEIEQTRKSSSTFRLVERFRKPPRHSAELAYCFALAPTKQAGLFGNCLIKMHFEIAAYDKAQFDAGMLTPLPKAIDPIAHVEVLFHLNDVDDGTRNRLDLDQQVSMINDWLLECDQAHATCSRICDGSLALPPRILVLSDDTQADGTDAAVKIRVHEPAANERGRYAALSYCWGGRQRVMLTTSNIDTMKTGIDLPSLPSSLRDAIELSRKLNLSYLWIDSLCIVQDSEEDKQKQIAAMGWIYRNAYITIVAAKAESVEEGFLARYPDFQYRMTCTQRENGHQRYDYYVNRRNCFPVPQKDPLFNRAWSYQERVLSARTIVFARGGVYWQCRTAHQQHTHTEGFQSQMHKSLPDALFESPPPVSGDPSRLLTRSQILDSWLKQVHTYTLGELSVDSDKLAAIAGIAELYHQRFGHLLGEYIAGCWENTLIPCLRWVVMPAIKFMKRPAWRAPTWSWAALNGTNTRTFHYDKVPLHTKCIRWQLSLKSNLSSYGELKPPSTLTLEGPIVQARMSDNRSTRASPWPAYDLFVSSRAPSGKLRENKEVFVGVGMLDPDAWPDGPFSLLVLASQRHEVSKWKHYDVDGIVLLPVEGTENTFVRCGWFYALDKIFKFTQDQVVILY